MRRLKLDLHTHVFEATGFRRATPEIVEKLVERIKLKGLDGIAVTEHNDKFYGFQVKELVDRLFPGEVLIIPGQEISIWPVQIVELYLPDNVTFRFLAHPGYPGDFMSKIDSLHGIEIDNPLHDWHINKEKVKAAAEQYDLLLLRNSDAHSLYDIGEYYNEVSLEELCNRARRS